MSYALLDDQFYDHPKVIDLLEHDQGLAAVGLWTLALGWAKKHADPHTPADAGHLPAALPKRLGGSTELAKLLVGVGLWQATEHGWRIHDFAHWQDLEGWAKRSAKAKDAINKRWKAKREADAAAAAASSQQIDTRSNTKVIATSPHLTSPHYNNRNQDERVLRTRPPDSSSVDNASRQSTDDGSAKPRTVDRKDAWVAWATTRGIPADDAALMTKAQLQDLARDANHRPGSRDDVERLCLHLAERIEQQVGRRPTVGTCWRTAARLLLDVDGHTETQVHTAIDWCQDDEFWRSNILSMGKLRAKYVTLRAAAARTGRPVRSTTNERVQQGLDLAARYAAEERGELGR